jgi:hypothetical protein
MSVSDDEESRNPSSPTSLASQFMTQARHFTNQVAKSPAGETATMLSQEPHAASSRNDLGSIFMTKARQLTGQRFDVSPFSPVSSSERSTFKLAPGGKTGNDGYQASAAYHTHAHKFGLQLPRHELVTTCFLCIFQPIHQALCNSSTSALPSCHPTFKLSCLQCVEANMQQRHTKMILCIMKLHHSLFHLRLEVLCCFIAHRCTCRQVIRREGRTARSGECCPVCPRAALPSNTCTSSSSC